MLFPTSRVEINCCGFLNNMLKNRVVMLFVFFSNSKRNLLEEIKAISMPEKNAEKAIEIIMIRIVFIAQGVSSTGMIPCGLRMT